MIHRVLVGADSISMAKDLLKAPPRILGAWDLSTGGFFNRVRVLSQPNVISSQQEVTFDDMLEEEAAKFRDVVWRNDVGAELGVVGTPIQLP